MIAWPGWKTVRLLGEGSFGRVYENEKKIVDYTEANNYWEDLWEKDIVPSHKWEDYKAMYQPQLNALRSEFVKLCPKPL